MTYQDLIALLVVLGIGLIALVVSYLYGRRK